MATLTTALLDFLVGLLRNPDAASEFRADPETSLAGAGLSNVCSEDVDAVLPVLLDSSSVTAGGDGGHHGGGGNGGGGGAHHPRPDDDHGHAVTQINEVINNYSYKAWDSRETNIDQSVNQAIWADGDVNQLFGNEAIIASGDDAIAVGGDVDASDDHSTNVIAGEDAIVGNEDNSTNVDLDVDVEDSFNEDNSTNVAIEDSFNDESIAIDDSFNEDSSTNVDVDVDVEDSFNEDNSTNVDVDVEDAFNDESTDVDIEDVDVDVADIDDSIIVTDNEVGLELGLDAEVPLLP